MRALREKVLETFYVDLVPAHVEEQERVAYASVERCKQRLRLSVVELALAQV